MDYRLFCSLLLFYASIHPTNAESDVVADVYGGYKSENIKVPDEAQGSFALKDLPQYAGIDCSGVDNHTVGLWIEYHKDSMGAQTIYIVPDPEAAELPDKFAHLEGEHSFQSFLSCFLIDVCDEANSNLTIIMQGGCALFANGCISTTEASLSWGLYLGNLSATSNEDIWNGNDMFSPATECPDVETFEKALLYPDTHKWGEAGPETPTAMSSSFWLGYPKVTNDFGVTTYIDWSEEDTQTEAFEDGLYVTIETTLFSDDACIVLCFNYDQDPITEGIYGVDTDFIQDRCQFCYPEDCSCGEEGSYIARNIHPDFDQSGMYLTTYIASMDQQFEAATSEHTVALAWGASFQLSACSPLLLFSLAILQQFF